MKTIAIREDEKFPVLKIVREEKVPLVEFPRKKVKKEPQDIPPHKYIMPDQPKGYRKVTGPDIL